MMFNVAAFWFTERRDDVACSLLELHLLMNRITLPRRPMLAYPRLTLLILALCGSCALPAADTVFRYQGSLASGGQPAEGLFDLRFTLHSAESGDSQLGENYLALAAPITNGLFTLDLDFGATPFNGDARWLEIAVRPSGTADDFVPLAPRQPVRVTPYAIHAFTAATAATADQMPWQNLTNVPEGFLDGVDDDTLYAPGIGLELLDQVFNLRFEGAGTADTAARSDHSHPPGDADTLDGLDSLEFAPATHGHELSALSGVLADQQLSLNIPRLDTDQIYVGTNQFDGVVLLTNPTNLLLGTFVGDGTGLTNLQGTLLSPGTIGPEALADSSVTTAKIAAGAVTSEQIAADAVSGSQIVDATIQPADLDLAQFDGAFWKVGGNAGTGPGFLGTTDDRPLEVGVLGIRALRIEPNGTNSVNLLAGSVANVIDPNVWGATISGGGSADYLGAPHANRVGGDFANIGGGSRNVIEPTAQWSTLGGGLANAIRLNAQWSAIAGGNRNQIEVDADGASIGGGRTNTVNPGATGGVIGGGAFNRIHTNATYATIPGGLSNTAAGRSSFAAGSQASALHDGAFVWADASGPAQSSSTNNQFVVRASGGTTIFSDTNSTAGVRLPPGSGSWSSLSDRDAKAAFAPVDPREVLERLAALPIQTWRYRAQSPPTRHMGPTAQDFHAQFSLGDDERRIATIDADGVALAGIQGLNLKLEDQLRQKETEIAELRRQLEGLSARLDAIMGLRPTNP